MGAELRDRGRGVDEAAMIAGQDRDAVAGADPCAASPRATALLRASTCANVSVPRSSMTAAASGLRIAADA